MTKPRQVKADEQINNIRQSLAKQLQEPVEGITLRLGGKDLVSSHTVTRARLNPDSIVTVHLCCHSSRGGCGYTLPGGLS